MVGDSLDNLFSVSRTNSYVANCWKVWQLFSDPVKYLGPLLFITFSNGFLGAKSTNLKKKRSR